MKSKEEIEQLGTKHYRSNGSGGGQYTEGLQEGRIIGYIDGYTQCQEDMAIEIAELKIICQEYSKDVKALNDMLNSLNKQD